MQDKAVRLVTIALDDRSVNALKHAFKMRCNNNCSISPPSDAQVALIDLDKKDARESLVAFRKEYAGVPVIAICKEKSELDDVVHIMKPFSVIDLAESVITLASTSEKNKMNRITSDKVELAMKALEKKGITDSLSKRVEKKSAKSAVSRSMDKKTDEMYFEPERFLLGEVLKADKQATTSGKTAVLTCWGDKTIIINNVCERIITDLNDNQIRSLAISPFDVEMASPVTCRYVESDSSEMLEFEKKDKSRVLSKEVFLWNLGYLTCRGRIPGDILLTDRVYLKRWPNLTRMAVPDNAMRIISYWVHQSSSLSELTEKLGLPMQDIFSVFTAAYTAGLAGVAKRQSDELLEVVDIQDHKKRNLFSSIISKLRGQEENKAKKTA